MHNSMTLKYYKYKYMQQILKYSTNIITISNEYSMYV